MYNLHLTNEQDPLRYYFEQLSSMDVYAIGQYLKQELEKRIANEGLPYLLADLLMAAADEIDFREIAQHLLDDYNNENN